MQEFGFIVKRFHPKKQKFSILSKSLGKIELIVDSKNLSGRLWPGMLISFYLSSLNNKMHIARNSEILMAPIEFQEEGKEDLFWLHQILEYCYFFLPLQQPCEEVFDCVYRATSFFAIKKKLENDFEGVKKLFLVKLFILFGLQPDEPIMCYIKHFERLVFASVDFANDRVINSLRAVVSGISRDEMERIDLWVMQNLRTHHNFSLFKTVRFMSSS